MKLGVNLTTCINLLGVPRSGGGAKNLTSSVRYSSVNGASSSTKTLDPVEDPSKEGRYRFTLAHEEADIGGCIAIYSRRTRRRNRALEGRIAPSMVCRSTTPQRPASPSRASG